MWCSIINVMFVTRINQKFYTLTNGLYTASDIILKNKRIASIVSIPELASITLLADKF